MRPKHREYMNIKEFINTKRINEINFEFNETELTIYWRPLTAGHKNELMKYATAIMNIAKKNNDDGDVEFTADEIIQSNAYAQKQAFYMWCAKNGTPVYKTYEEAIENIPADLFEVICSEITAALSPKNVEDIEGN